MKHIKDYKVFESSEPEIRREYYPEGTVKKEEWYLNGKMHRVDEPASITYYPDGTVKQESWYLKGKLHRVDEPASIWYYPDGTVNEEHWYLKGKLHRVDEPASIWYYPDGKVHWEEWYLNGKRHRVDGPVEIVYYPDGKVHWEEWYLNGIELTKAQWVEETPGLSAEELVEISNSDPNNDVRRAVRRNPNFPEDLEGWAINLDDWT